MPVDETNYIHDVDKPLTSTAIESYAISRWLLSRIENARQRSGVEQSKFRILDFGCGRGQTVASLRLLGYQAWGMDVHSKWIEFARPGFRSVGLDADDLLRLAPEGGQAPFEAGHFDFIYSVSVMEHVENLSAVMDEIARLTAPGASGFHQFIGSHSLFEGHLRMPLVHWLPKNEMRCRAIKLCLQLGIDPQWEVVDTKGVDDKAEFYYRFSVDQTFYRPCACYLRAFEAAGLQAKLDILEHPKISHRVGPLLSVPYVRRVLDAGVAAFLAVNITTVKPRPVAR